jgi:hypothetical protein
MAAPAAAYIFGPGRPEGAAAQEWVWANATGPELCDRFMAGGPGSATRRTHFREYVGQHFGAGASQDVADTLARWLEFAHLGCMPEGAPAAWVLAAAGTPFVASVFTDVAACTAARVVQAWPRVAPSRDVDHRDAIAAALSLERPWSTADVPDDAVRALALWLSLRAAEEAGIFWWRAPLRDACFDGLSEWLRTQWTAAQPGTAAARCLPTVTRVGLGALRALEERTGVSLPLDLRRLLLEVGDVGEALFSLKLMDPANVVPGQWAVERTASNGDPLRGSHVLGAGGGGDATCLVVVLTGPCRSQVWVADAAADDDDDLRVMPLTESLWRWVPDLYPGASALFGVLCYAAHVDPAQFSKWAARGE